MYPLPIFQLPKSARVKPHFHELGRAEIIRLAVALFATLAFGITMEVASHGRPGEIDAVLAQASAAGSDLR